MSCIWVADEVGAGGVMGRIVAEKAARDNLRG
jgi:hypothetical protein